ncbi:hypothetical protein CEQ90_10185 [Lewinellaceae bacterium SD302]|nr:hypothetical protein CEQ90_10185 [Lewinellaceae bacterium SD302]
MKRTDGQSATTILDNPAEITAIKFCLPMRTLPTVILLLFGLWTSLAAQCDQFDFSHLDGQTFVLDCDFTPITLQAVLAGDPPSNTTWINQTTNEVLGFEPSITIAAGGEHQLLISASGCTESIFFFVEESGILQTDLPTGLELATCLGPDTDTVFCLNASSFDWDYAWSSNGSGACLVDPELGTTYTVTITKANGCSYPVTVETPSELTEFTVDISSPDPCDPNLFTINFTEGTGGDNIFEMVLQDGSGNALTFLFTGEGPHTFEVPAGDYTGFAYGGVECEVPLNFTAGLPGIILTETVVNVSCNGVSDGAIDLTADGQAPPFTYNWSTGQTTEDIDGLVAGVYIVTVTDGNGCSVVRDILVEEPNPIFITLIEIEPAGCAGENNGSIVIEHSVSGLATVFWSNGWDTEVNDGLEAGEYTVTVTDDNTGCFATATYTVEPGLDALIDATGNGNLGCDTDNVQLFANPAGPDYNATWFLNGGAIGVTQVLTVSEPGEYVLVVTDVNDPSCTGTDTLEVTQFDDPVDFDITVMPGNCGTNTLPGIVVIMTAGNGPYTHVLIQDGVQVQSGFVDLAFSISNLSPTSVYELILTSNVSGCSSSQILPPLPFGPVVVIEENLDACGGLECFEVTVTGGTAPYVYLWSDGSTGADNCNLPAGTYCVTVIDANGCTAEGCGFVEQGNLISTELTDIVVPTCDGNPGSIFVEPVNGTAPYTFLWTEGPTGAVVSTEQNLINVPPGTYVVEVTDASGCTGTDIWELFPPWLTFNLVMEPADENLDNCGFESAKLYPVFLDSDGSTLNYTWLLPGGGTIEGQDTISVTESGVYELQVEGVFNVCYNESQINVDLGQSYDVNVEASVIDCNDFTLLEANYPSGVITNTIQHEWLVAGDVITTGLPSLLVFTPGEIVYLGTNSTTGCISSDTIFLATVGTGCSSVSGTLWADEGNCALDGTEIPVPNWPVLIETASGDFSAFLGTDINGEFYTQLSPGNYIAYANPYNSDLYYECPTGQAFTVVEGEEAYVDVFMPYLEACATMYTNVSVPQLRRCFENDIYVTYCNDGPVTAEDATVTVDLDPFLNLVSASVPPSDISQQSLTFELGDLAPFECGTITIRVLVSCDAVLGQTHCVEATATPNDPCPDPANWNGANLTVDAVCDGEEIIFTVTNDGTAPTTSTFSYIVIEDGIMLPIPGPGPILEVGGTFTFSVPANGSTYYFQTSQEEGNPDFTSPTIVVEGCGLNSAGTFSTGFANALPLGDASTDWYDIQCRANIGAYDPNEKTGFPLGLTEQSFIEEGTNLNYHIQFQNTGTDTAFTVVLRDTIAPEYDLSTLRMGSASHPYVYEVDSNRALTVTFNDIMLPDSNVNLLGSQGIVSYVIDHVPGVEVGTQLRNQAAIYFDFNAPIFTSRTLHTIGEDITSSLTDIDRSNEVPLTVFPNPADRRSNVSISIPVQGAYQLEVYDNFGRMIMKSQHRSGTASLNLSQYPAGWYLVRATRPDGTYLGLQQFILD